MLNCQICETETEGQGYQCMNCGRNVCEDCYNTDENHECCSECEDDATWCQKCDVWIDWDKVNTEYCDSCAEDRMTCDGCGDKVESEDDLNTWNFSEWNNGYKNHYSRQLCDSCYEERCPSIDPQEIAESMTNDEEEQEVIADAIQNNIDTHGEIWKQLKNASIEECWKIVEIMGIARSRHEDTNYDELLRAGVSRDTARELIK